MGMISVIAMFAVIGIIVISENYTDSKHKEKMAEQGRTINIGYSSEDCSGKNYELVSEELSAMGFDNIVMVDLDDSGLFKKENTIENITIEGKEFSEDDYFSGNEKVVISYH